MGVNGLTPAGFNTVGGLRTFLPWAPLGVPGVGQPTQVAWLWPLVDRPHRTVGDTWADDALAREIAAGGRLANLLAAGLAAQDQHPAPPPRKRKHHKVKPVGAVDVGPGDVGRRPACSSTTSRRWPPATRSAPAVAAKPGHRQGRGRRVAVAPCRRPHAKSETLALPYADPDVVAAARAGLGSEVQVAINSGTTLLSQTLGTTPVVYAWPPSGFADQRTVDTLFAARVSTIVLDGIGASAGEPHRASRRARTRPCGRATETSTRCSPTADCRTVVGIGANDPSKAPLAVQRFLAETLMVQAERPNRQRTLVIAPDRRWAPAPSYATALADRHRQGALDRAGAAVRCTGRAAGHRRRSRTARLPADRPARRAQPQLPRRGRRTQGQTDTFASILATPGGPARAGLRRCGAARPVVRVARPTRARVQFLDDANAQLDATMHKVHIASLPNSFVTLTSHSGTVPITVSNELDTPVSVVGRDQQPAPDGVRRRTKTADDPAAPADRRRRPRRGAHVRRLLSSTSRC